MALPAALAAVSSFPLRAQQREIPVVGFLHSGSPAEWTAVPGPARTFALTSCVAELRTRPSLSSSAQASWNACVRSCGESLRACRAPCDGGDCSACTDGYERCTSLCDFQ